MRTTIGFTSPDRALVLHGSRLLALCAFLAPQAFAQGEGEPSAFKPPKYSFLRQNEDWSGLRGHDGSRKGFPNSIKYVPFNEDGSIWASFGGHVRLRGEAWRGFNFGAPTGANPDDEFLLGRVMAHGDFHFGDHFRLYAEGKAALSTDRDLTGGKRSLDEDTLDLQQAFVDLSLGSGDGARFTLRPGRQMFLFGKQRLVSPLPWANTLRTWDGVSGIIKSGSWNFHGFWSRFVPVQQYDFNTPDQGNQFYGVYATMKNAGSGPDLDVYWLGLQNDQASFNGTSGEEERNTVGARVNGKFGDSAWDYDLEAAYQFGSVGDGDVSAWMSGAELGYRLSEEGWKPRAMLGVDTGSGDSEDGGDVGTFNQLYPLGHAYLGYIDTIGRQNILAPYLGIMATPGKWKLSLAAHSFHANDTADALYNAGGGVYRAGGSYTSKHVGYEVDLRGTYSFSRQFTGLIGYSHFFAGDAIEESGPSDDIDFLYLGLQYTF